MPARSKNGRFQRTTTRRRRSPQKTNLMAVLESVMLANAVTQGAFNTDIREFITGVTSKGYRPGSDGSSVLTLPELLGAGPGGIGGNYAQGLDLQSVLKSNIQDNGARMLMQLIAIPIAFRVGAKLLKKPRAQANRLLKQTGMGVKV